MKIRPDSVGRFQLLLQPASPEHNWRRTVELLRDLEYAIKLLPGSQLVPAYSAYRQQSPSDAVHPMVLDKVQGSQRQDILPRGGPVAVVGIQEELPAYVAARSMRRTFRGAGKPAPPTSSMSMCPVPAEKAGHILVEHAALLQLAHLLMSSAPEASVML